MIEISGKIYITEKEASKRYGYSVPWFKLARKKENAPPFCRVNQTGRILYPTLETDEWFVNKMNSINNKI